MDGIINKLYYFGRYCFKRLIEVPTHIDTLYRGWDVFPFLPEVEVILVMGELLVLSAPLLSTKKPRFVSHAWQEGVFEFLSQLTTSWPCSARHAWCCMLANPQNLNIGSMLQCPMTSPFALALQASRHMLVVPNHCCSLYTRLWCGYEAYVASEQGKVVQLATPPRLRYISRSLLIATVPIIVGLFFGLLLSTYQWDLRRPLVSWHV